MPPTGPFVKVLATAMFALGTVVGGKYRIEQALAQGGMGSVWVGRHVQLGSTVAVKFLDPSLAASPAHRARFEREARSAANLKSPHVVHVQDYGFEGEAPYIVMELLEGEDLDHRLRRMGRLHIQDTGKILTQFAKALKKAHEAGIVHRDLKPANLFIARVDDDELIKVLDFGIAKETTAILGNATKTGEVMGSPHYMSPEQVRAERDLDLRTDLWAVGVILYRMVVGSLPFPGDQLGPVLAKILTETVVPPSHICPDLPPSLDAFFAKALARDKTLRFQSIAELVEAYQQAAGGRPMMGSMSLGTSPAGGAAAAQTGGFATQPAPALGGSGPVPMGAGGPIGIGGSGPIGIGGSGPIGIGGSGPIPAGTTAGLVTTGAPLRPKGAGVAVALGGAAVLGAAVVIGFFVLRAPSTEPAAGSGAPVIASSPPTDVVTSSQVVVVPTVPATAQTAAIATSSASTAPSAAPSTTGSVATAPPVAPSVAPKPTATSTATKTGTKGGTTKPKEKWF